MQGGTELLLRDTPFTTSNPKEFWLDNIQGYICSTVSITIPPFMAVNIHCKMDALGHCMQVDVLAEPVRGFQTAHIHCADCYVWRVSLRFLLSANLSKEPECLSHHDSHEGHHWESCSCQPGATSNFPDGNFGRVLPMTPMKDWILDTLNLQELKHWSEEE